MTAKPRRPWRVILTQNGIQLAEIDHTSEAKAYVFVRAGLGDGSPAGKAEVRHWEDGRWILCDRLTADELL